MSVPTQNIGGDLVNMVCWNTLDAPGPEIDTNFIFEHLPREGEQIEIDGADSRAIPDGIYYVHCVRHVFHRGGFRSVVEVTTQHPGLRR